MISKEPCRREHAVLVRVLSMGHLRPTHHLGTCNVCGPNARSSQSKLRRGGQKVRKARLETDD